MSAEDMALNSAVRGVIAGFTVDDSGLFVASRNGHVFLRGKLNTRMGADKPLSGATIQAIEETLLKQKGVKKVSWQLDNWKMVGLEWVQE